MPSTRSIRLDRRLSKKQIAAAGRKPRLVVESGTSARGCHGTPRSSVNSRMMAESQGQEVRIGSYIHTDVPIGAMGIPYLYSEEKDFA